MANTRQSARLRRGESPEGAISISSHCSSSSSLPSSPAVESGRNAAAGSKRDWPFGNVPNPHPKRQRVSLSADLLDRSPDVESPQRSFDKHDRRSVSKDRINNHGRNFQHSSPLFVQEDEVLGSERRHYGSGSEFDGSRSGSELDWPASDLEESESGDLDYFQDQKKTGQSTGQQLMDDPLDDEMAEQAAAQQLGLDLFEEENGNQPADQQPGEGLLGNGDEGQSAAEEDDDVDGASLDEQIDELYEWIAESEAQTASLKQQLALKIAKRDARDQQRALTDQEEEVRRSETEWREFSLTRQLLVEKVTNRDPFAAPMLALMVLGEDRAQVKMLESGVDHSFPLSARCLLPPEWDMAGVITRDVLAINPPDNRFPGEIRAGWATDELLELFVEDANTEFVRAGLKAYAAPPIETHMFISRETFDDKVILDLLQQKLQAADFAAGARTREEYQAHFPASNMPVGTERLLMITNVDQNHWVVLCLFVNEEKTVGRIQVYDPRWNRRRGNTSFREVAKEAMLLARIVAKRAEMEWRDVAWGLPESVKCLVQKNDSDCGFFARHFVMALARGEDVLHYEGCDDVAMSIKTRYQALQVVHRYLLSKELSGDHMDQYLEARKAPRPGSSSGKAGAGGTTKGRSKKSKDVAAFGSAPQRTPQQGLTVGTVAATMMLGGDIQVVYPTTQGVEISGPNCGCADIRQTLCNIMLEDKHKPWGQAELLELVVERVSQLAVQHDSNVEGEEDMIRKHAGEVLTKTNSTFVLMNSADGEDIFAKSVDTGLMEGEDHVFMLDQRPGRLVDTETQNWFISRPARPIDFGPLFETYIDLMISITRTSQAERSMDAFVKMEERCAAQVNSHWELFGHNDRRPLKIEKWSDEPSEPLGPSWASYVYCGSSSDVLLSTTSEGQRGATANRIRVLLRDANHWARLQRTTLNVGLLQNGVDGGSNNNDTWNILSSTYDHLRFHLIVVTEKKRFWHPEFFARDPETEHGWTMFDVAKLASLYEGPPVFRDHTDECHLRFLTACTLVSNFKRDHGMQSRTRKQNVIAASFLTGTNRKTFDLQPGRQHDCAVCQHFGQLVPDSSGAPPSWVRGEMATVGSGPIYFRCTNHSQQELQAFEAATCEPDPSPLWTRTLSAWYEGDLKRADLKAGERADTRPEGHGCSMERCERRFESRAQMLMHQKADHAEFIARNRAVVCGIGSCTKTFDTSEGMATHKRRIHDHPSATERESERADTPFRCVVVVGGRECGRVFNHARHLVAHAAAMHKSKRNGESVDADKLLCPVCRMDFETEQGVATHLGRIHPGYNKYAEDTDAFELHCPVCRKGIKTERGVVSHLVQRHPGYRKEQDPGDTYAFECPVCRKGIKTGKGLISHIAQIHPGYRKENEPESVDANEFFCPVCSKSFKTGRGKVSHLAKKHPGYGKEKDPEDTDASENDPEDTDASENNPEDTDAFELHCPVCRKGIDTEKGLESLLAQIHPTRPGIDQKIQSPVVFCRIGSCDRSFGTVDDLEAHRRQVHPEVILPRGSRPEDLPVRCKIGQCGKLSINTVGLMQHLSKTHKESSGLRLPVRCDILGCGQTSDDADAWKDHIFKAHRKRTNQDKVVAQRMLRQKATFGVPCPQCGHKCASKHGLTVHIAKAHPREDSQS